MPPLELVWGRKAEAEFKALLERRYQTDRVRDCVEGQALALAANPRLAEMPGNPTGEIVHAFVCTDTDDEGDDVKLYLWLVASIRPDGKLAIVRLQSNVL